MRAKSERKGIIIQIKGNYITVQTKGFMYYFMAVTMPKSPYFLEGQEVEFSSQIGNYTEMFDGQFILTKKHRTAKDVLGETE